MLKMIVKRNHQSLRYFLQKHYSTKKGKGKNIGSNEDPKKVADFVTKHYPKLPDEPTTCCMTGCANCVWLEYAEKLSEYFKDGGKAAFKEINERISDPNIKAYLLMEIKIRTKFKD